MLLRPLRLRIRDVFLLLFGIILNNVTQTRMAYNHMDISPKDTNGKTGYNGNSSLLPNSQNKNNSETVQCPSNLECERHADPCIKCDMTTNCTYGDTLNVSCSVLPHVNCIGNKTFEKKAICRFCYQTEHWEHSCELKGDCVSVGSPRQYYSTNCSVLPDIVCLGKRRFPKRILCNWTGGARWSTALILSLTLGGFGADRFYLGHWQEGIGKLFSFGGLGVWTLLDVVLISVHHLGPADGSLYI